MTVAAEYCSQPRGRASMPTHSGREGPKMVYGEKYHGDWKKHGRSLSKENIGFLQLWEVSKSSFGGSDGQENAFFEVGSCSGEAPGKGSVTQIHE